MANRSRDSGGRKQASSGRRLPRRPGRIALSVHGSSPSTGNSPLATALPPTKARSPTVRPSTSITCPRASGVADTADDPLVHPIPDRFPEPHGPGVVLLHQRRDASGPLPGQPLLGLGYQHTGYPLPALVGLDGQPVDVAPPAIE